MIRASKRFVIKFCAWMAGSSPAMDKLKTATLTILEISAWYQKPNKDFGGLSPREYLRGKDWDERYKIGKVALIKFGVLKP